MRSPDPLARSVARPRPARLLLSATVVTASVLVLAGCTNPIDQLVQGGVQDGVERIIEEQTGSDIEVNTGGGASLPEGWPAEIPVPDGSPMFSMAAEGGYQATFEVADAAEGERIKDQLVADGYVMEGETDMGQMKIWILAGPEWRVSLSSILPDEGDASTPPSLTYLVSPVAG